MLCTKAPVYQALRTLALLAPKASENPVLTHVLVEAEGDLVTLTATDGTTHTSTTLGCVDGHIRCALPLRQLMQFVRPADRADRAASIEMRAVEDGKVIVADEGAITTLESLPPEHFPACEPGDLNPREHQRWSASDIDAALAFVLPLTQADASREFATGVSIEPHRVVATDGHRLHIVRTPGLGLAPVLLHRSALLLLRALLPRRGEIGVARDSKFVRFVVGASVITTRPMDTTFPPIDQIVPPPDQGFSVETEAPILVSAVRRFPSRRGALPPSIRLAVNGKLEFTNLLGDSMVSVPLTENGHTGDPLVMGLNPCYLAEAVGTDQGRVQLRFGGALDPIVITPSGDRMAVVMPVRL